MKKSMNQILFNNLQKFAIKRGTLPEGTSLQLALSINRNLAAYGYSLDLESIKALSTQNYVQAQNTMKDLIAVITEHSGVKDFTARKVFYPNFPEEVMRKSEVELYLNAMLYYTFSQTDDARCKQIAEFVHKSVSEIKLVRLPEVPVDEEFGAPLKIINLSSEEELITMMDDRIHSLGMSKSMMEELFKFQKEYPEEFSKIVRSDKKFQSKETLVNLAFELKSRVNDIQLKNDLLHLMKDSKDVIRFAALLSNDKLADKNKRTNTVDLKNPVMFDLSTSNQKLIKSMLHNCKNLYYDIWRDEELFKKLMPRLKTRENCTYRVKKAFDNLHNREKFDEEGRPITSIYAQLNEAMANVKDKNTRPNVEKLVSSYPGAFLSNYISYIEHAKTEEEKLYIAGLASKTSNTPVYIKLKLKNLIERRDSFGEVRYNTHPKMREINNDKLKMSNQVKDAAIAALDKSIAEQVKDTGELGKVYIDPELEGRIVPERQLKNCSEGPIILPYSRISIDKEKNLLGFAIYWKNYKLKEKTSYYEEGDEIRADIDLHLAAYNEDFKQIGRIWYGNLRLSWGCHSGDYTDASEALGGAVECIMVDKELCKQEGIAYLVPVVKGFNIPFNLAENVRFCKIEKDGSLDNLKLTKAKSDIYPQERGNRQEGGTVSFNGELFNISEISDSIKINADGTSEIPCIVDVNQNTEYWLDSSNSISNMDIGNLSKDDYNKIAYDFWKSKNNALPNMYQLFDAYARENATEIVDDIAKADTIFSVLPIDASEAGLKPTAKVITSFELDNISTNYAGNPDKLDAKEKDGKDIPLDSEKNINSLDEQLEKERINLEQHTNSNKSDTKKTKRRNKDELER